MHRQNTVTQELHSNITIATERWQKIKHIKIDLNERKEIMFHCIYIILVYYTQNRFCNITFVLVVV